MKFKLLVFFGLVCGLTGCAGLHLPPPNTYPPYYYNPPVQHHMSRSRVVYVPVVVEEPRRGLDPYRQHRFHWR